MFIDGVEATALPEAERGRLRLERLGCVFQEYALLPELTAEENVYLPGHMLGLSRHDCRERARELLELVGLAVEFAIDPARCRVVSSSASPATGGATLQKRRRTTTHVGEQKPR